MIVELGAAVQGLVARVSANIEAERKEIAKLERQACRIEPALRKVENAVSAAQLAFEAANRVPMRDRASAEADQILVELREEKRASDRTIYYNEGRNDDNGRALHDRAFTRG